MKFSIGTCWANPIIAACTPADCFTMAMEAFRLAVPYRVIANVENEFR